MSNSNSVNAIPPEPHVRKEPLSWNVAASLWPEGRMDRGGGEAYVPSRRIALESGEVTNGDFHMESVRIKVYKQRYIRSTVNGVKQVHGRLLLQGCCASHTFFFREK